eukprot:scaffold8068_cov565-Prasinococcus_capsulatus_cf.AAC.6
MHECLEAACGKAAAATSTVIPWTPRAQGRQCDRAAVLWVLNVRTDASLSRIARVPLPVPTNTEKREHRHQRRQQHPTGAAVAGNGLGVSLLVVTLSFSTALTRSSSVIGSVCVPSHSPCRSSYVSHLTSALLHKPSQIAQLGEAAVNLLGDEAGFDADPPQRGRTSRGTGLGRSGACVRLPCAQARICRRNSTSQQKQTLSRSFTIPPAASRKGKRTVPSSRESAVAGRA